MRLFYSPTSPYVRKVMVLLKETGLESQVTLIPALGTPLDPGTQPLAQNPIGKIPVLERPEGPALYDSRVILRYLDTRVGAGLYPEGERLWDVLTLEATAEGIIDAALLMIYEGRLRPEELRFAPWVEGQWSKIARSLDAVEARWMSHLAGPLDISHIAMGCALGYLDFRHEARNWRQDRPALSAWYEAFSARPSMMETVPPA